MNTRVHALSAETDVELARSLLESARETPERLMEKFLDGDAHAFELLFKQLAPRVASALTHMAGDARLAEDLTQVAFLKLYRARSVYQRGMQLTPWLFAIARNVFLDERRKRRRRPEALSSDGRLPELAIEPRAETDERAKAALQVMLQSLPDAQRQVLLLLKVQELSLAEVAALSGTSVASVKMRVHRAYRSLRARRGECDACHASGVLAELERERTKQ